LILIALPLSATPRLSYAPCLRAMTALLTGMNQILIAEEDALLSALLASDAGLRVIANLELVN
jgi:hypothetical protein